MNVVLVATDGSESSIAALKQAAGIASSHGAQLLVLTVISTNRESGSISDALNEYARAEHFDGETEARSVIAENILAEAKAIVADRHDLKAIYISRAGDPAEEILACAREHLADVVLLGCRGRGPLGAFWFGSVSRRVADAADCSVTIVPTSE
jgi:nucleotide-binding universal stress UspA family protein